jgi:hypothetical protein
VRDTVQAVIKILVAQTTVAEVGEDSQGPTPPKQSSERAR